jgi:hypothetical protein
MPGLVAGIHVLFFTACREADVDGRDKPGYDVASLLQREGAIMVF